MILGARDGAALSLDPVLDPVLDLDLALLERLHARSTSLKHYRDIRALEIR